MQKCSKCKTEKNDNEFNKGNGYCKICQYEYMKKYRLSKGKEHWKKKMSDYRKTENGKAAIKRVLEKRKEISRLYAAEYRKKNPEKIKEYKERTKRQRQNHLNERLKTDINFRIKCNLRRRLCHLVRKENKSAHTMELLGCSIEFFHKYLESKWKEGMAWENYGVFGWHIDHIIPCDSFDLTKKEEQCKCFHYSNLQPLWWHENLAKGSKVVN